MHHCLYEDKIRFILNKPNISQQGLKLLYDAAKSNHIVFFNTAGKKTELCINDTSKYMNEYSRHLADTHIPGTGLQPFDTNSRHINQPTTLAVSQILAKSTKACKLNRYKIFLKT